MNSKFPLHRRTLLRGLGVSLALPCLDAMRTAQAASASVANPTPIRMAWVFFPNGTNAARWLPEGEGRDWKVSSSLEPLAELRDDFLVLRGLAQRNAASLGDGPGDHALGENPAKHLGKKGYDVDFHSGDSASL